MSALVLRNFYISCERLKWVRLAMILQYEVKIEGSNISDIL